MASSADAAFHLPAGPRCRSTACQLECDRQARAGQVPRHRAGHRQRRAAVGHRVAVPALPCRAQLAVAGCLGVAAGDLLRPGRTLLSAGRHEPGLSADAWQCADPGRTGRHPAG
ncbi:hypothetical protein G6F68_015100 [Rhizopus microsporus]|nr:hypothetical protein G6F68_015100 [Rhizopus microsporus]